MILHFLLLRRRRRPAWSDIWLRCFRIVEDLDGSFWEEFGAKVLSLLSCAISFVFITTSVTIFGEISPIWQNFTNLWRIVDCSFPIWQNAESTLANLWHYWVSFHCCKWPNIEKYITIWSHWMKCALIGRGVLRREFLRLYYSVPCQKSWSLGSTVF